MRILVADDQPDVLVALRFLLKAEGYAIETADTPAGILKSAAASTPDLILMDLNYSRDTTSGEEGLSVLDKLQSLGVPSPVVVMTAWGSVELAVEAMRRGAVDFVMKPWDNERLAATLSKHLEGPSPRSRERHDLDLARQVQSQLLPQRRPPMASLSYDGCCRQAGAVGGDYYDFLELAPGRLGLVLADISGKGISAALLMANLQAGLRSLAWQAHLDLPLTLRMLNMQFLQSTPPERYATLFFADYDDRSRRLRYANCGHLPAMILRNGSCIELPSNCTVLGLFDDFHPAVGDVQLQPGDRLIIYSDGVTEAPTRDGADLGEPGLLEILRSCPDESPVRLADRIAGLSPTTQFDDMTLVLGKVL